MKRITKEPEVRKQEILEAAMELFNQNGYEKTSISDIAKKLEIAQGLCYRYFPSKDVLFDCAIQEYAQSIVDKIKPFYLNDKLTAVQILAGIPSSEESEIVDSIYNKVLHNEENNKFHDLLSLKIGELLIPIVVAAIKKAVERKEIKVSDYETAAYFCVYGSMGIRLRKDISIEEKEKRLKEFITSVLF